MESADCDPSLADVLMSESVAAAINISAIGSPPESLAYCRSPLPTAFGGGLREAPDYAALPMRNILVEQTGHTP